MFLGNFFQLKSMGNDLTRRHSDHSCDDATLPRIMNNLHPLKFHYVHGEYVTLSKSDTVARRYEGFCKGIVFSHRPVAINEYIYIKFLDISNSWSGALRIGFTSNDPVVYRNKLPKYACPYMTDINGNWARALAERLVKKNSVLFYYINHNGDVHYGFDNEERGIFFGGVNTTGKLWALLDIYGNTVEVEFVDPRFYARQPQNDHPLSVNLNRHSGSLSNVADECQFVLKPEVTDLGFHCKHGRNVSLKSEKIIKGEIGDNGYAFLNRPLNIEEAILICVSNMDNISETSLIFGVTSCNPSKINGDLPDDPDDLVDRSEYWVVQKEEISNGDELVFAIAKNGALMFRKNFELLSVVAFVDNTLPLWFFIDLLGSTIELKLMGSYPESVDDEVINCVMEIRRDMRNKGLTDTTDSSSNDGNNECVICYEAQNDCALYRCGHACMCYRCAYQLWQSSSPYCPVCRTKIDDVLKIFK